jgi:hypothetical protein
MSVASILALHGMTVSTHRKAVGGKDDFGQMITTWPVLAASVPFHLQLGAGALNQEAMGQMAEGHYPAYGLSGVGLVQGDGIQIQAAPDATEIGRRFVVERCKDWGRRGGWQGEVSETDEDFDEVAS